MVYSTFATLSTGAVANVLAEHSVRIALLMSEFILSSGMASIPNTLAIYNYILFVPRDLISFYIIYFGHRKD